MKPKMPMDDVDRRLILATQGGLPLVPAPYAAIARELRLTEAEVMERLQAMQQAGIIRRIAAVPNHYALGYRANGMAVWDVPDERIAELGQAVGALAFVSHCYQRPRHPPLWPFNLFAMVHGRDRNQVETQVEVIASLLGEHNRGHCVLYSTRILKKTGLRLVAG